MLPRNRGINHQKFHVIASAPGNAPASAANIFSDPLQGLFNHQIVYLFVLRVLGSSATGLVAALDDRVRLATGVAAESPRFRFLLFLEFLIDLALC